ncbi:hypothetical protein BKA70DRAFT_1103557 [Coprinopsis sp. MPI-PUGE-AT-0042]|nr:hypothetical protein BKA70DRAFT_1103557 [Coprinopsis sp. MPI-PUGE-AT-0042]
MSAYPTFNLATFSRARPDSRVGQKTPGDPIDDYGDYTFLPPTLASDFPLPDPERKQYHEWNAKNLRELYMCMAAETCGKNQRKVALLAAHWFEEAVVRGWRGGEGVWGLSMYKHLRALGYTTLFANSFEEALELYRMFPSLVSVVVRNMAGECHSDPNCVKSESNPSGIPAWKIFDFEYFTSPMASHFHAGLLQGKWTLSANPEVGFEDRGGGDNVQYIGFSVEDECRRQAPVPLSQRHHRVFMLMKQISYVYQATFAWNRTYFPLVSSELGTTFVGAWMTDQNYQWNPEIDGVMKDIDDPEKGVINLRTNSTEKGLFGPDRWLEEVRMSKVMLGMGNPWWSPSPYHALCAGVPFINPILSYDMNDPWNKERWNTQHPSLNHYGPPHVYHVHRQNYTGFVEALRMAMETESPSFIPPHMTEMAVRERVRYLMEHDWRTDAEELLEKRKKEGKGYVFVL